MFYKLFLLSIQGVSSYLGRKYLLRERKQCPAFFEFRTVERRVWLLPVII